MGVGFVPRLVGCQVRRLCLDFDGVLHGYSRGWQGGEIYDPPTDGCYDAVEQLAGEFELVVCTCREYLGPVWEWLEKHGMDSFIVEVTNKKPIAEIYIDDRAVHHVSWTDSLRLVHERGTH